MHVNCQRVVARNAQTSIIQQPECIPFLSVIAYNQRSAFGYEAVQNLMIFPQLLKGQTNMEKNKKIFKPFEVTKPITHG